MYFARAGSFSATTRSLTCLPGAQQPSQQRFADTSAADDRDSCHGQSIADAATARFDAQGVTRAAPWRVGGSAPRCGPHSRRRCGPRRTSPGRSGPSCTARAASRRPAVPADTPSAAPSAPSRCGSRANVTGADTSPHRSANSTSGATPFGRTQYSMTGGPPSERGVNVVSDGLMSQPLSQMDDVRHRVPRPDRLEAGRRLRRHQRHHRVDRQQRRDVMFRVPSVTAARTAVRSPCVNSTSMRLTRRPRLRTVVTTCIGPGSGAHRKFPEMAIGWTSPLPRARYGPRSRTARASRRRAPSGRSSSVRSARRHSTPSPAGVSAIASVNRVDPGMSVLRCPLVA